MAIPIRIDLDQTEFFNYVAAAVEGLQDYDIFVTKQVDRYIRIAAFDEAVRLLAARAGPGWSQVYTDHLVRVLKTRVPILGGGEAGRVEMFFDLEALGGYSELSYGRASQALISTGTFLIHPPQVELPYIGQPLISEQDARQEFWENVVVDRDGGYAFGPHKQFTMANLGYVQTYDEVAMARVLAWGNKAPEWLWLENGFNESKPEIYPVDFARSIESVATCIASSLFNKATVAIIQISAGKKASIAVGASGRPFEKATGRFISYKDTLDKVLSDFDPSKCLGSL